MIPELLSNRITSMEIFSILLGINVPAGYRTKQPGSRIVLHAFGVGSQEIRQYIPLEDTNSRNVKCPKRSSEDCGMEMRSLNDMKGEVQAST